MIVVNCYIVKTIKNNIRYLLNTYSSIILINTKGLSWNRMLQAYCSKYPKITYVEIENNSLLDFGKWHYALTHLAPSNEYKFIICTNDSYYIHNSINHFYNLIYKYNVDLYGYNESSQVVPHYQSYLFALKNTTTTLSTFIQLIESKKHLIKGYDDVVDHYELCLYSSFASKSCFLKLSYLPNNVGKCIFFINDALYLQLMNSHLLPFSKLKRFHPIKIRIKN